MSLVSLLPLSPTSLPLGAVPSQSFPQVSLLLKVAVPQDSVPDSLFVPLGNCILPMAPATTSVLTTPNPVVYWASYGTPE